MSFALLWLCRRASRYSTKQRPCGLESSRGRLHLGASFRLRTPIEEARLRRWWEGAFFVSLRDFATTAFRWEHRCRPLRMR